MLVGGLAIREAVATSLLVIMMNSLAALAGSAGHASLDMGVLVPVAAIAMAGSMLGMRLGRRLSTQQLQRGFGGFIVVIGTLIRLALEHTDGNRERAAQILGMSRVTLWRHMKALGLQDDRDPPE